MQNCPPAQPATWFDHVQLFIFRHRVIAIAMLAMKLVRLYRVFLGEENSCHHGAGR